MKTFTPTHRANIVAAQRRMREQRNADRLEDVSWLAETGESLSGAAARLGLTNEALRQWCRRFAPELAPILVAREPRDPNQRPGIEAMRTRKRDR